MTTDDAEDQAKDLCTLKLTPRELQLLLKYGYPFDEEEKTLRASTAVKGYHHVRIGAYWIEMMCADVIRSAKELHSQPLLEELDALCDVLETAITLGNRARPYLIKVS